MAYGSAHTSTLPTVGVTTGPSYATLINAAITEIRATLDAKVTPSGFSMASDLTFLDGATNRAATNLERAHFQNKGAAISAATYPVALYVVSGDLYFNDNSGRQVRVTNGGALNISGTGGITGAGYGSGGVEVNWDAGANAYRLKSGSGANSYASVILDDVLLRDGSDHSWRLASPALAADLTLTMPAAYPGSTSLMTMGSSGTVALTRDPSVDTITTSGAGTIGGNLGVTGTTTSTGLITATAGLTAASNQHVTVAGNGRFKHGTRTQIISAFAGNYEGNEWTVDEAAGTVGLRMNAAGTGSAVRFAIRLDQGKEITSLSVNVAGDAVNRLTCELFYVTATGERTSVASGDSTASASDQTVSVFSGTQTVAANQGYYLSVGLRSGSAPDSTLQVYSVALSYTEP